MPLQCLICLIAGALIAPSLAPYSIPYLALLPAPLLYLCSRNRTPREGVWLGWWFGLGFFGSGVSWVFVSISEHSPTPLPIAVILTFLFVAALALLFSIQIWLWRKYLSARWQAVSFIGLWLLFEWLRSWFLTGFPWLYLGNAALDTPLQTLIPLGGVWLASTALLVIGLSASELLRSRKLLPLLWLPLPLLAAVLLPQSWTTVQEQPLKVAVMQPNIAQQIKWNPTFQPEIFSRYDKLSRDHLDTQLLLWPETAIPALFSQAARPLAELLNDLDSAGVTLLSGLPSIEQDPDNPRGYRVHNSTAILTTGSGIYHKQRLVPFGEYVPMEALLRGTLAFFNLPMSSFSLPQKAQPLLNVDGFKLGMAICYEIAYPELVRQQAQQADILVTVSNDTWFGHSIAPAQHMQIARVRALENGRWLIRGTNNGISGLINPQGEVVAQLPQFSEGVLRGEVFAMQGQTPFQRVGSWPLLSVALILCLLGAVRINQTGRKTL